MQLAVIIVRSQGEAGVSRGDAPARTGTATARRATRRAGTTGLALHEKQLGLSRLHFCNVIHTINRFYTAPGSRGADGSPARDLLGEHGFKESRVCGMWILMIIESMDQHHLKAAQRPLDAIHGAVRIGPPIAHIAPEPNMSLGAHDLLQFS